MQNLRFDILYKELIWIKFEIEINNLKNIQIVVICVILLRCSHGLWKSLAISRLPVGVINRDLIDASAGTHIILEIIWDHLSRAVADVAWPIFVPNANPPSIANQPCASKDGHAYSQRRAT